MEVRRGKEENDSHYSISPVFGRQVGRGGEGTSQVRAFVLTRPDKLPQEPREDCGAA